MSFDLAVIGLGGIGSSVLNYSTEIGLNVIGIDQFSPPHTYGSSHGETRAFRQAYFEHENYVPMLKEAYSMWKKFALNSKKDIFYETGVLALGKADGNLISGMNKSAKLHDISIDKISSSKLSHKYPYFNVPKNFEAILEKKAGTLFIENIISENLKIAKSNGANVLLNSQLINWNSEGKLIELFCSNQVLKTKRLVICAGAWSDNLLSNLGMDLKIRLKHMHWINNSDQRMFINNGCPVFCFESDKHIFYGFPEINKNRIKIAQHTGGTLISKPSQKTNLQENFELQTTQALLEKHIPFLNFDTVKHDTCLYTMSPDEHFIVDNHPNDNRISFAAGLSGHGFKFSNILGKILCDLVTENENELNIDFLKLKRFNH